MSLTREQVLATGSGQSLNCLVSEIVLQQETLRTYEGIEIAPMIKLGKSYYLVPGYSEDISASWEVIGRMRGEGYRYVINVLGEESGGVERGEADIGDTRVNFVRDGRYYWAYAKTAQEAICKAALLAVLNL